MCDAPTVTEYDTTLRVLSIARDVPLALIKPEHQISALTRFDS